jgi:hypothetical protein
MVHWAKFDKDDMSRFITECEERKETIARMKLENSTTTDLWIALEPQGSSAQFPAGKIYDLVAVDLEHIKLRDGFFTIFRKDIDSAVFNEDGSAEAF